MRLRSASGCDHEAEEAMHKLGVFLDVAFGLSEERQWL